MYFLIKNEKKDVYVLLREIKDPKCNLVLIIFRCSILISLHDKTGLEQLKFHIKFLSSECP